MSEDINSGLLQDVRDLEPHALHASPADGTDGDKKADSDQTDGDSDGDNGADTDGTDSGDSNGTDTGDADGTDNA